MPHKPKTAIASASDIAAGIREFAAKREPRAEPYYNVLYCSPVPGGTGWLAGSSRVPVAEFREWILNQLGNGPVLITNIFEV